MRLSKLDAFIFDADGVLHVGKRPVEGVADIITFLREEGKKVAVLTNNASKSRAYLVERYGRMNLNFGKDEIMTSAYGAARYIKERYGKGDCYVIGEDGLIGELEEAGHRVLSEEEAGRANFIVVGLDRGFNYGKIDAALKAHNSGAYYVACNEDPLIPTEEGRIPGAGCMVAAVSKALKKKPDVLIGKPNTYLLELLFERMGLERERTALIGDSIETDVICANRFGIMSILVLSENTIGINPMELPEEKRPKAILMDLKKLLSRW